MRLAKAVLASVVLAGGFAVPASAAGPAEAHGAGPIALVLTVTSGERALPAGHTALLGCEPLGDKLESCLKQPLSTVDNALVHGQKILAISALAGEMG